MQHLRDEHGCLVIRELPIELADAIFDQYFAGGLDRALSLVTAYNDAALWFMQWELSKTGIGSGPKSGVWFDLMQVMIANDVMPHYFKEFAWINCLVCSLKGVLSKYDWGKL